MTMDFLHTDSDLDIEECDVFYEDNDIEIIAGENVLPEELCTPEDGLIRCRNKYGRVVPGYISRMSGMPAEDCMKILEEKSAVFPDPQYYGGEDASKTEWLLPDVYGRGNLHNKLCEAEDMNRRYDGRFAGNIRFLKSRLPDVPLTEEIHISLGATWIPTDYYSSFIRELLEMSRKPDITYNEFLGKYLVSGSGANVVLNNYTYGTIRMSAMKIIEATLNTRTIKVCDAIPSWDRNDNEYVINQDETLAAQEKQRLIFEAFDQWIHSDRERLERLTEIYAEKFCYSLEKYDGSWMTIPGKNPDIQLYEHQKNAIARIVLSPNSLIAHDVGTGKTYVLICSAHELHRMKLCEKIMIVTPNNVLDATVKAHRSLYPDDEIFAIYPKDFSASKRHETLDKIKNGNYTAIYMAYSSFDMITMSGKFYLDKKRREIHQCSVAIDMAENRAERNALKAEHKKLTKEYNKLRENFENKEEACFDNLGIDALFVDECHNYKNISLKSRTGNIVGMHARGSRKCDEMFEKVHWVQRQGGRIVFATGTPLTNSLADLYVLQLYLQKEEMELCGISKFNEWITTFCEQDTSFEIDVDSQNFRFITRFSRFHNLTELMSMFSSVCDFYHSGKEDFLLPDFDGYEDIVVEKSKKQAEYIRGLAKRTEDIRAHMVNRKEDNLLKVTTDGRKCALDFRLVAEKEQACTEDNKTTACAKKIVDICRLYPDTSQIVFCDCSTPKAQFNIYDELKKQLLNFGLAKEDVVFIHDGTTESKRRKLLQDLNDGRIRVMVGSTVKLGIGVNVQENLIAIHHLDVPWRPSDMVQREGRLIRQGNKNKQVFIYRYVTEGSFDSYTWQLLENKQKFISSFLSGTLDPTHREEGDIADTVLNYAEIKALAIGNPLIRKRVEVSNHLEHLRIAQRQRRKQLAELQDLMYSLPNKMRKQRELAMIVSADEVFYKKHKVSMSRNEREEFGAELLAALAGNVMQEKERVFDWYQEFDVVLPEYMPADRPHVILRREGGGSYMVKMGGGSAIGCSRRLDHILNGFPAIREKHMNELKALKRQLKEAETELEKGNPYDELVLQTACKLEQIDNRLKVS